MKDIVGKRLSIGDEVAFIRASSKELKLGIVEKFCPKMVTIRYGTGESSFKNVYPDQTCLINWSIK